MPEETPLPEGIEVSKPVIEKGKVVASFKHPAPERMRRVIKALVYFCSGLGGVIGATDVISSSDLKVIMLFQAIIILALGSLEIFIGVKPAEEK